MVYNFPPDTLPGFLNNINLVAGIQANIWTERIQSEERLDYMTYPRLSALAEAGWTKNNIKNIDEFYTRLKPMLEHLREQGIEFYNPFEPQTTPEPLGDFRRK
jgi:hexosaminidase